MGDTPEGQSQGWYRDRVCRGTLLVVAAVLAFQLGARPLWQDEAETALLGQNVLRFGLPVAYDGKNLVSQEVGRDSDANHVWRWSPWLQFYLAAGSMALFGHTTWAARLPFAILGLLAIPATFVLTRRLFGQVPLARLSVVLLAFSVPFHLHAHEARWHGPALLLVVLLLIAAVGLMQGRTAALVGVAVAGVLLFYTNFFIAIGILAALPVAAVVCRPGPRFWVRLAAAYAVVLLCALPGVLFFSPFGAAPADWRRAPHHLWTYVGSYFTFLVPLPALAALVYGLTRKVPPAWRAWGWPPKAAFLLVFSLVYMAYLALGPWTMFRYLAVLLPVAAVLLALAAIWVTGYSPLAGKVGLALLLFTNVLHLVPLGLYGTSGTVAADPFPGVARRLASPWLGLVWETLWPPDDPERAISGYLNAHARPEDVVLATYGDLPLQFYTGLKVVGGLQGQAPPRDPDWIVVRSFVMSRQPGKDAEVKRFIEERIDLKRYSRIELRCADVPTPNNPDPRYHWFRTPPDAPPVVVYHKAR